MPRIWDIAPSIDPRAAALVDDDQPVAGRVVVTWLEDGARTDEQCDGWLDGGLLFLPFDGQSPVGSNFDEGGLPWGPWYEATSGLPAIVGLAGAPLAIFA